MIKRNRRAWFLCGSAVMIMAFVPFSTSAEVPAAAAGTSTATCAATSRATPVSYTPGTSPHGTVTVTVTSTCTGSGFAYADTIAYAIYYTDVIRPTGSFMRDCGPVTTCVLTFSFTGGPYNWDMGGQVFWQTTNGQPWQMELPSLQSWPLHWGCLTETGYPTTMFCDVSEFLVM
jgi:hypothetical protein